MRFSLLCVPCSHSESVSSAGSKHEENEVLAVTCRIERRWNCKLEKHRFCGDAEWPQIASGSTFL